MLIFRYVRCTSAYVHGPHGGARMMQTLKCLGSGQYTTCFNLRGIVSVAKSLPPRLSAITGNHISLVFGFRRTSRIISFYEAVVKSIVKPVFVLSVRHAHHCPSAGSLPNSVIDSLRQKLSVVIIHYSIYSNSWNAGDSVSKRDLNILQAELLIQVL